MNGSDQAPEQNKPSRPRLQQQLGLAAAASALAGAVAGGSIIVVLAFLGPSRLTPVWLFEMIAGALLAAHVGVVIGIAVGFPIALTLQRSRYTQLGFPVGALAGFGLSIAALFVYPSSGPVHLALMVCGTAGGAVGGAALDRWSETTDV